MAIGPHVLSKLPWESKTILETACYLKDQFGEATVAWNLTSLAEAIVSGTVFGVLGP